MIKKLLSSNVSHSKAIGNSLWFLRYILLTSLYILAFKNIQFGMI